MMWTLPQGTNDPQTIINYFMYPLYFIHEEIILERRGNNYSLA